MAKIADVLTTEQNRQASTEWGKIHLFEMGDFYRAYEWSAWLIVAITYSDKVRNQTRDLRDEEKAQRTIDSYLGILSHTASYHMAQSIGLSKPLAA